MELEMRATHTQHSFRRVLGVVVVGGLLLGMSACGSSKGTSDVKPDAKKAAVALAAGLAAQSKGQLDVAARDYNKVLQYDKNNKYAYYNLALIDAAHSDYGLAEAKYRRTLSIDPRFEPALFNLAILVKAKGDTKQAISLYQRAIAAAPKDAAAHLNLGLLLRESGQKAAGNAEVTTAIKLNPKLRDPAAAPPKSPTPLPS